MNKMLFLWLYGKAENNHLIGRISVIGTKLSYYIFFLIFILGGVYIVGNNYNMNISEDTQELVFVAKYFFVPFIGIIINSTLRKLIKKERPFSELGKKSLIEHKKSYSFPSNHACSSMLISFAIIYARGQFGLIGLVMLILAFLTGLSRIMTGVHYPADVIAGWIDGAIIGYIGFFII